MSKIESSALHTSGEDSTTEHFPNAKLSYESKIEYIFKFSMEKSLFLVWLFVSTLVLTFNDLN